jgi:hypothetical protein
MNAPVHHQIAHHAEKNHPVEAPEVEIVIEDVVDAAKRGIEQASMWR